MAAPNIVNVSTITGTSTFSSGITTNGVTVLASNAANSNQVYKVNTILATNTSASIASVTVRTFNAAGGTGTSTNIAFSISIPSGSTLAVLGKDTPIYLPENTSIGAFAGVGNTNNIDIITSYEVIS
jgi:hypothetical protein